MLNIVMMLPGGVSEVYEIKQMQDISKILPNLDIKMDVNAEQAEIIIHQPITFVKGSTIDIKGFKTQLEFKQNRWPINIHILTSNSVNQRFTLGKDSSTWHNFYVHLTEDDAKVLIGDNCLLSKNILMLGSDGHAIMDIETNKVINEVKRGIIIEDKVWIGANTIITKNAVVKHDSVVAAGAVVTKEFASNSLIAGNPAIVIKQGIKWYRGKPKQIREDIEKNENNRTHPRPI